VIRLAVSIVAVVAALLAAAPAQAATPDWTVAQVEQELMCIVCHQRLDQSSSAFADGMRAELQRMHRQGLTEQQVLDRMVAQFGEEVLAAPPKRGFDLLAWLVPAAVLLAGASVASVLALLWARSRRDGPGPPAGPGCDPLMEARIDQELEAFE
jgi:cytochrome c-type biogenesis protein CcmH